MPSHTLICQNPDCGEEFEARRSDAKYCHHNCKVAHHRARRKEKESFVEAVDLRKAPLIAEREETTQTLEAMYAFIEEKEVAMRKAQGPTDQPDQAATPNEPEPEKSPQQLALEFDIQELERMVELPDLKFYNLVLNPRITRLREYVPAGKSFIDAVFSDHNPENVRRYIAKNWVHGHGLDYDQELTIKLTIDDIRSALCRQLAQMCQELRASATPSQRHDSFYFPDAEHTAPASVRFPDYRYMHFMSLEKLHEAAEGKRKRLEEVEKALREIELQPKQNGREQHGPKRRINRRKKGAGLSPGDLRNMDFNTLDLSGEGELGEFLGDLEPNMLSFALIGDPQAGKSTFSFRLAKLFLNIGKRVKYFSLEEGAGRLATEKLDKARIANDDPFEIIGDGDLNMIRQAAKEWDVVILDSWSVLDVDPGEYNKLRTDYPETIFIVIFQKTTSGTIRGGSKIIYDTPACINVFRKGRTRFAEMTKSRYGTPGWVYSISEDEIISTGEEV